MSGFLNSVLSEIGGDKPSAQKPRSSPIPPQPRAAGDRADRPNGSSTPAAVPVKRKAESIPNNDSVKVARKDGMLSAPVKGSTSAAAPSIPKMQPSSTPNQSVYRGTARPSPVVTSQQPLKKPVPVLNNRATAASAQAPPTASAKPSSSLQSPASAPKKGSFREILERAKAANAAKPIGAITHKAGEKLSKKERLAQEEAAKAKQQEAKAKKGIASGSKKGAETTNAKDAQSAKEKKKPAELGYKGTMRPSGPTYKGTMGASKSSQSGKAGGMGSGRPGVAGKQKEKGRYAGYASYPENDSEDEEDEQEDEGDYSDVSSDMEAGAFDVEGEEILSLRTARKEDEEALQEEEEHKRKKAERKKMLAKMAAEASKKRRF